MLRRRRLLLNKIGGHVEPNYDIMIWADSGYDGVVRVNSEDFQLTESQSEPGFWYGTAPSSVTSLHYFLKHDSRNYYNSTSVYIKKVKFGTGMYSKTGSCTNIQHIIGAYDSDVSRLTSIDVSNLNTSACTNMNGAFADFTNPNLVIKGYENFDTSNVTNFTYCFNSIFNGTIDIHNWHIPSGAAITGMFIDLATVASEGYQQTIYYTPGYCAVDPVTVLGSDRLKPVPYPYHDINVLSNLTSGQKIYIYGVGLTDMTYDSALKIWYYDYSGNSTNSFAHMFRAGSSYNTTATNVLSISFGESISTKLDYSTLQNDFLFAWKAGATNLASIDLSNLLKAVNENATFSSIAQAFIYTESTSQHGTGLSTIYGLNEIKNKNLRTRHGFRGCESLVYIDLGEGNTISETSFEYTFWNCTGLVRLENLPSIPSGCSTANAFSGCSSLTTIGSCGDQYATISFADSPLSLETAKILLRSLQTVTSETITFSNTTVGYINSDGEATLLAYLASLRGWNLPNVNTSPFYNIKGYSFDAAYIIDDTDCIEAGYCYSSTNSTPDIVNDDYEVGTVSDSILTAHIYKESEYWNAADVAENCDGTIYTEPDGSTWMRVSHQENPADVDNNGLFSNGQRAHYYKINANAWINFEMDRYIFSSNNGGHEYMCKQKALSTDTETKFRWIQTDSGCRCTYDDVDVYNITKIETTGYDQSASTVGGIWAQFASSNLASNNRTRTNSWGRVMQWTQHNSGLAGYNNTLVTTGYSDYYVRIDNTYFGLQNDTQYYVRAYVKHSDNTVTYYPVETVTTNDLWYQTGSFESTDITDTAERGINRIGITVTAQNKESRIVNIINAYSTTSSVSWSGSSKSNLNSAGPMVYTDTTTTASGYSTSLTAGTTYYFSNYIVNEVGLFRNPVHSYKTKALPAISGFAIADIYTGSSAASDTNVYLDLKFTITNADSVTITAAGIARGTSSNPTSSVATTTTSAGTKTVSVGSNNYSTTYYYRPYITYTNDAGTATNIFGSQVTKSSHVVLSRKSATGTSGSCSVQTKGTSATQIYVNKAVRFFPTSTYNNSSYTLSWELRRSSTSGTLIASGTVSYYSSSTAFVNHANHNMSNANSTSYTHYLIFWRTGDTSHKVYYVSDSAFAEKSASAWYTFHYHSKS